MSGMTLKLAGDFCHRPFSVTGLLVFLTDTKLQYYDSQPYPK